MTPSRSRARASGLVSDVAPTPFNPSGPLSEWSRLGKPGKEEYAGKEQCMDVREKLQAAFKDPGKIPLST